MKSISEDEAKYLLLLTLEAQERARKKLLDFILYTFPEYDVNFHHKISCEILQRFIFGDIDRLIFQSPPRHGKTEIVSRRLPAFIFGNDPDTSIISASYSAKLAMKTTTDIQRIMETPEYRELFPGVRLGGYRSKEEGTYTKTQGMFEIVKHKGIYASSGVGGSGGGYGAKIFIIDDPIKNRKEAESLTYRNAVWDWYCSIAQTRLEKDGKILITTTRWHEDDLVGRLEKRQREGGDKWTKISFSAIKEDKPSELDPRKPGQPLWPNKYSLKVLEQRRINIGTYNWLSLYQQRPGAIGGNMIQGAWFKRYKHLPEAKLDKYGMLLPIFDRIIQSWDMTFKEGESNDFIVGQAWGQLGADFYLLEQARGKWSFKQSLGEVERFTWNVAKKYQASSAVLIEDKANGPAIISMLREKVPGILPVSPTANKSVRVIEVSPCIEAGNVFIPDESIAGWVNDLVAECEAFPNSANDDQVDAMTQALWYLRGRGGQGLKIGVI